MDRQIILKDFAEALDRLQGALELPAENDVIKAGCIQYFEFSFELAWKAINVVAESQGLDSGGSPKAALKCAFAAGWIDEEDVWLEMLFSRNKMAHTYQAEEALKVYKKLSRFLSAMIHLNDSLAQTD